MRTTTRTAGGAILAALLALAPASHALEGSAPVSIDNGTASLECGSSNQVVVDTSGTVACSSQLPQGIATTFYTLTFKASYLNTHQYDAVYCLSAGTIVGLDYVPASRALFCGCAYEDINHGASGRIYSAGTALCATGGNVITAYDRVKISGAGVLEKAEDHEIAIGVATSTGGSGDSEIYIEIGQQTSPIVPRVKHIAWIKTVDDASINSFSFAPINSSGKYEITFAAGKTSTLWIAGAIESGITCSCESAVASAQSVIFSLCKGTSSCGSPISTCTISAAGTTCTDSSFSGTSATVATDALFIKQARSDNNAWCEYPVCRFAYSETEY